MTKQTLSKLRIRHKIPVMLFAALLTIDVSVMIFEKLAAAAAGNAVGDEFSFYMRLLQLPWTWLSIVLSPVQLLVWSKILSKTDLSVAYPISSLCFPFTMIASAIFFHDHITWPAWLGGILIASGIGLVGGEPENAGQEGLEKPAAAASALKTGQEKPAAAASALKTGQEKPAAAASALKTGQEKPAAAASALKTGQEKPAAAESALKTGQNQEPALSTVHSK